VGWRDVEDPGWLCVRWVCTAPCTICSNTDHPNHTPAPSLTKTQPWYARPVAPRASDHPPLQLPGGGASGGGYLIAHHQQQQQGQHQQQRQLTAGITGGRQRHPPNGPGDASDSSSDTSSHSSDTTSGSSSGSESGGSRERRRRGGKERRSSSKHRSSSSKHKHKSSSKSSSKHKVCVGAGGGGWVCLGLKVVAAPKVVPLLCVSPTMTPSLLHEYNTTQKHRHKDKVKEQRSSAEARSKLLLMEALRSERVAREEGERQRATQVLSNGRCGGFVCMRLWLVGVKLRNVMVCVCVLVCDAASKLHHTNHKHTRTLSLQGAR